MSSLNSIQGQQGQGTEVGKSTMDANNFVEFIPILHILICFRYRGSILFQTLDDLVRNLNSPNQSEWVLIASSMSSCFNDEFIGFK